MKIQLRKVIALFKKDMKDTSKNVNVMILLVLPLLFTFLYQFIDLGGEGMPKEFILFISVLMNLCLVPVSFLSMIIAEEKEKNTLRTLMLSNVSAGDFLLSKSLVTFLYMQVVNLLIFFIIGQDMSTLLSFLGITTISSFCMIFIGAVAGLVSKDQMSTSLVTVPFMLIFLIPPMFEAINPIFAAIARWVPTTAMMNLYFGTEGGAWYATIWFQVLVILLWTAASAVAFGLIFRKRSLDN